MKTLEIACALITRETGNGIEVLLEQRAATNTVMPGLWELPALDAKTNRPKDSILTVRHAIMQVNYTVHIHAITEEQLPRSATHRCWLSVEQASSMALTGLARKILTKSGLIRRPKASPSIAAPAIVEVL